MSLNTTVTVPSPSNAYDQLYAGIDYSSLNWYEQQWVAWYTWIGDPVIATGLLSFIMHEVVYFGRSIPWIIIDAIPYFRKWKLQPAKVPSPEEQWKCVKQVLFGHFTVELPTIWLFHPLAETVGMKTYHVPFPHWQTMVWQIAFFMFFEDLYHFVAHRALHIPLLYKHIHKIHHKYSAPFGLAAEYAHPAEVMILGFGTLAGSLVLALFTEVHFVTFFIWVILKLFQAVDSHSGYDFPWSLQRILPFWSGADHHDFHHMAFTDNFATSFRWWDRIFGTDVKFQAYQRRKKSSSQAELIAIEREAIAEGLKAEAKVINSKSNIKVE
ncbi:C-4 sterol methyl oxidase [Marasmius crinis-equi]|uniref:C-4 sterol methyl oxidase n=1 Tax=Marasmius crinis-equi TaxID=585013 RepID=A0ABR3F758_9AGAR